VEVDRNLVFFKHIVQLNQAVVADKLRREHHTVAVHKNLKVDVLFVFLVIMVKTSNREVVFGIEQFILEFS
jgi:hypothetical protein